MSRLPSEQASPRLWHPWLRVARVIAAIRSTRWGPDEWPTAKAELGRAYAEPSGSPAPAGSIDRLTAMTDAPRARFRVLIVDDEPSIAEVLRDCLGADYRFELVHSGMEALAAVARERPDVVLLDVSMPGMSGVDVLRRLKVIDPSLPVIMITATDDSTQIAQTAILGALGYIPKPFTRAYVQHLVATAVHDVKR